MNTILQPYPGNEQQQLWLEDRKQQYLDILDIENAQYFSPQGYNLKVGFAELLWEKFYRSFREAHPRSWEQCDKNNYDGPFNTLVSSPALFEDRKVC
jgi:hypothetical protein